MNLLTVTNLSAGYAGKQEVRALFEKVKVERVTTTRQ